MSQTREQIIQTTSALLEMQGYYATGLSQIVQESGAPKGSLYYYFPEGKEQLTAEAIARSGQMLAEHVRAELGRFDDPAEAVFAFVNGVGEHVLASECRSGAPIAAVALETAATSPRLAAACWAAYEQIQEAFAEGMRRGGITPERATHLATVIVAALEGAIILSRTSRTADPLWRVAASLRSLIAAEARRQHEPAADGR